MPQPAGELARRLASSNGTPELAACEKRNCGDRNGL